MARATRHSERGAQQTISHARQKKRIEDGKKRNELCWLGREGRQQGQSTTLRQSRENLH
jgi:hypothetical protein